MTLLLRSIHVGAPDAAGRDQFPFTLPLIAAQPTLTLPAPVTILVGENGSGKSTLLEALAYAARLPTIGSQNIEHDETLVAARRLGRALRLVWNRRSGHGFFLRAEDFFGFVKRISAMQAALAADAAALGDEMQGRSRLAQALALSPLQRELDGLRRRYGDGLDTLSHGESFLRLFQSRFVPDGLYVLDEPETPLSPLRQLALIAQIKTMVAARCQFVIATHSPILMAYPDAHIVLLDGATLTSTAYDALEHVRLTRDFLNDPAAFLRHL